MSPDEQLTAEQVALQVRYWLELADYDLETARVMLASRRMLYVGFMCHQVIEKGLKGVYSMECQAIAPKIHALVALAQKSGIHEEMTPAQQDCLEALDPMNIECRYPAETDKLLAALTVPDCETMLSATEEMLQWIKHKLSNA